MPSPSNSPVPPLVLAIGQFDGVHRGHQAVFRAAVESARAAAGVPGCLTFFPHVAQLLNPARAPLLLATPEQNQALIAAAGIAQIHAFPFTREFAAMDPEEFLALLKLEFPALAEIVVGRNFTFGRNRAGHSGTLPALAAAIGCRAQIVPHVELDGAPVSSTRIRAAVAAGDLPLAKAMLGRPFSLTGAVVHGRAVGRTLGFPTANLAPGNLAVPAHGVYIAETLVDGRVWPSAVNIGIAPTVRNEDALVETHLLGFTGDLIGKTVEIIFHRRLRPEQRFSSLEDLKAAIRRDLDTVRAHFSS